MLVNQFQNTQIYSFFDKLYFKKGWQRQMIAFLSGLLTVLALPPVCCFPICFCTFSVLARLLRGIAAQSNLKQQYWSSIYHAALTGWSFGFGYFTAGLWWLGNALLSDIAVYWWLFPFAVFGLPAFLAIFYGLASFIAVLIKQNGYRHIVILSCAFGFTEWLRSFTLTGFPWNSVGYLAMPFPLLMQSVALIGIYGMNILAILIYAAPSLLFENDKPKTGFIITLLFIIGDVVFGIYRFFSFDISFQTAREKNIIVRIIQPSISLEEKINEMTIYKNFERHLSLSSAPPKDGYHHPQIIVWPETAIPFILDNNPEFLQRIGRSLNKNQFALIGTIRSETVHYFNSIYVIDSFGQHIAFADKVHLVPFGEYMPFASVLHQLKIKKFSGMAGNYTPADRHKSIVLDDVVIFPLICYEIIFASEMEYDGPKADFLVNITNDTWFDNTPGPWQHFAQARVQAVAQGLPLVRAANNGISAIIDPLGRITAILPPNRIGFLDAEISFKKMPVYNKYSKFIPTSCLVVIFFLGLRIRDKFKLGI